MDDLTTEDRLASINEINVLKMLHHPNIIGYYDSFTAEKSLMIVMEYAPGICYDTMQRLSIYHNHLYFLSGTLMWLRI